jgi:phosphoglycerol transferase MdoB-like AlkP superfamily enzyme
MLKTFIRTFLILFLLFSIYRLLFIFNFDCFTSELRYWSFACRFDLQVIAYLHVIPFFLMCYQLFMNNVKQINIALKAYWIIVFIIVLFGLIADFLYFDFFNERLSKSIFLWLESPGMMLGVIKSTWFYLIIIPIMLVVSFFIFKYFKSLKIDQTKITSYNSIFVLLSIAFLLFIMIRGSLYGTVLKSDGLVISSNLIKNNSVFNPFRTFFESLTADEYLFYSDDEFKRLSKEYEPTIQSMELPDGKKNIVLILVESLSSDILIHKEGEKQVMPFLNQLKDSSIYVPNLISSGSHTFNGIYSSLTGAYSLPGVHSLSRIYPSVQHFSYPQFFQNKGLNTSIMMSHDSKWDNVNGFFKSRGVDSFIDFYSYSAKDIINDFGVPDAKLLSNGLMYFNNLSNMNLNFFSAMITISSHGPHVSLDNKLNFQSRFNNVAYDVFAYTDSCLMDFFKKSSSLRWFNETVFIITGDHGCKLPFIKQNDIMAYYKVPALVYYNGIKPLNLNTQTFSQTRLLELANKNIHQVFNDSSYQFNQFANFCTSNSMGCIFGNEVVLINKKGNKIQFPYDDKYKKPSELKSKKMIEFTKYQLQKSFINHKG